MKFDRWFVRVVFVACLLAVVASTGFAGGLFGWVPAQSESTGGIDWSKIVEAILSTVLTVAVPFLTVKAIELIAAAKKWLDARKDESWYAWAGGIVADAVLATSQTLGDEIKEAAKDGKFTEEEKARLFNHARDLAIKNFGVIPGRILPVLESWVKAKIEAELAKLKILKQIGPVSLPLPGVQTAVSSRVG